MRQWLVAILMFGALFVATQLPRPVAWTLVGVMAAVMWYFFLTAFPHSRRRWEDIKDEGPDHHRDFPPSSR